MTSEGRVIDDPGVPRFEVAPHHCFVCGTTNARGMGLRMHAGPRAAWTELTYERDFEGWDGIAHGGIIAAILDEVMAWSLASEDAWGVTARMAIQYHAPVRVGAELRAEGRVTRARRRLVETEATLRERGDGQLLASATGLYVAADEARKQEMRARYRFGEGATPGTVDNTR